MSTVAKTVFLTPEQFKAGIETRTARIGIIGLGYVGLPLALLFSGERFAITGFDIDQRKVGTLSQGGSYIVRIEPEEIRAAQAAGFTPTTDFARIADMDAIIICVPTPLNEYREPDLSYMTNTAESIAPHLHAGATGHPGKHHLSRHHRRGAGAHPRKGQQAGTQGRSQREPARRISSWRFLPSAKIPATPTLPVTTFPRWSAARTATATELAGALYGAIFRRTVPVSTPAPRK